MISNFIYCVFICSTTASVVLYLLDYAEHAKHQAVSAIGCIVAGVLWEWGFGIRRGE